MPMCVSCHHAYDETHARAGMHGKKHSDEAKRKMSKARKGKSWLHTASPEKRAAFGDAVRRGKARVQGTHAGARRRGREERESESE